MDAQKKDDKLMRYVGVVISLFALTFIWYQNNHWSVLMGDDIIAVSGFQTLGFWENLVNPADIAMGKVRPISKILLYVVYLIGGVDYKKYYIVTRILIAVAASIVYILLRRMNLDLFKAFVVAGMMVICPFSAYGAWQYIGVCEIFSLLCCVMCGFYMYQILYEKDKIIRYVLWCTLWFALLIFNAERFMYLIAVFALVVFMHDSISIKDKLFSTIILFLPIIIRSLILKMMGSIALGTGRSDIYTLIETLIPYALRGFVNIFGFSLGDSWHGGFDITQISAWILMISACRMFMCIGVLFEALKKFCLRKRKVDLEILMWYLFSLTSLFSYALVGATHGEDRFLWTSYAFYLIAISRYLSSLEDDEKILFSSKYYGVIKRIVPIFCTILLVCSNYYYLISKIHVHYRYSQEMAETAIENIYNLDSYESVENIACVKPNDYFWVFGDQSFFKIYLNENVNVYYYDSSDLLNADREALGEKTIVIYLDADYKIPYGTKASWIINFGEEI